MGKTAVEAFLVVSAAVSPCAVCDLCQHSCGQNGRRGKHDCSSLCGGVDPWDFFPWPICSVRRCQLIYGLVKKDSRSFLNN